MSITKDLEIKISNGVAKLSEDVYVYQKDRGIELRLKLNVKRGRRNISPTPFYLYKNHSIFYLKYLFNKPSNALPCLASSRTESKNP